MVCAGLLSVIVFPVVSLALLRAPQGDQSLQPTSSSTDG
jgi:hypothetical protein